MSTNFIKTWPCTDEAKAVSIQPECPIAQLFGQSFGQAILEQLNNWISLNCDLVDTQSYGKFVSDAVHRKSASKFSGIDSKTAIRFNWQYSPTTISSLRVKGLYLNGNIVDLLCSANGLQYFYDYQAVYNGCAIQIYSVSTS